LHEETYSIAHTIFFRQPLTKTSDKQGWISL